MIGRRKLLGSTAATVALAPVAIPAAHPDAELIAACTAFKEAEAALFAVPDDDASEHVHSAANDRYHVRHKALIDIRATTLAGLKAKARAVIGGFEMMVGAVEDVAEWHDLGVYRVLQDVLQLGDDAPLAQGAAAQPHPDAELLALAARFIEHEQAMQHWPCDALPNTPEDAVQEATQRRMCGVQRALSLQLGGLRATTADGIAARAHCLAVHNAEEAFSMDDPGTTTGRLVHDLMRDAAALGGVVQPVAAVSPDAALLEACAAFDAIEASRDRLYDRTSPAFVGNDDLRDEADGILLEEQGPWIKKIIGTPATTCAGVLAKLRSFARWEKELIKGNLENDAGDAILGSACRDLIGEGGT